MIDMLRAFFLGEARSGQDQEYMRALREAQLTHTHPAIHALLLLTALFFSIFLVWAAEAELEEVTRGMGQVVPSSRTQVIQSLERGVLTDLLVVDGDPVEEGQVLCRLDATQVRASLEDALVRRRALLASVARLEAERDGTEPVFPLELTTSAPEVVSAETESFLARREAQAQAIESLEESLQAGRRSQQAMVAGVLRLTAELGGGPLEFPPELEAEQPVLVRSERALFRARQETLRATVASMERSLGMARRELTLHEPLVAEGAVSEIEVLRLERQVNDLQGRIDEIQNQTRKATAEELQRRQGELLRQEREVSDLLVRVRERRNLFRSQVQETLTEKRGELARLGEVLVSLEHRVGQTELRSPVRGVVKKVHLTTQGGVVPSGAPIMEIVPLEDTLVVEAQVLPSDIAFLRPGLSATVKILAYDFSIYGGLSGVVEGISADTLQGPQGQTYYLVRVRTEDSGLGKDGDLPIIPGMTASVDVLTGKKTVLQYLAKPFLRARWEALRER